MNGERMACLYLLQRALLKGVSPQEFTQDMRLPPEFFETASSHAIADLLPNVLLTAIRLTGDKQFALESAQHLHPCLFGSCGLAATHAPTLEKIFDSFAEYGNQLATWYYLDKFVESQETTWTLQLLESCPAAAAEQIAVAWVTTMTTFGRIALGETFQPERVSLQQAKTEDMRTLEAFLRCSIQFEADQNTVCISRENLQAESRLHDSLLFDQLVFSAAAIKRQMESTSINDAVDLAIRRGAFSLSDVAKALKLSERTIQRRLKDEGTSLQEKLDTVRQQMAEVYLRLPSLTVQEIATRVGFSSDKAFRTAYRRWTGRSPREEE